MRDTFVYLLELILMAWLLITNAAVMIMRVPVPDAPVMPSTEEPTPFVTWFPATITPSITPTATPTPAPVGNIPEPNFSYACYENNGTQCVHPEDSAVELIAHTIFNEGGSLSYQIAVDVLQVIYNNVYSAWTCLERNSCPTNEREALNPDRIPWSDINSDTFTRLVLFVLSTPYTASGGTQYAAFNGWHLPLPASVTRNPTEIHMYSDLRAAVGLFLANGDKPIYKPWNIDIQLLESRTGHVFRPQPALKDASIQCFYATFGELPTFFPIVAVDYFDNSHGERMYISYSRTLSTQEERSLK